MTASAKRRPERIVSVRPGVTRVVHPVLGRAGFGQCVTEGIPDPLPRSMVCTCGWLALVRIPDAVPADVDAGGA